MAIDKTAKTKHINKGDIIQRAIIKFILFLLTFGTVFQSCKTTINLYDFEYSPEHYPVNGKVKFISSRAFTTKDSTRITIKDKKEHCCDDDWWFNKKGQVIQHHIIEDTTIIYDVNYLYTAQGKLKKYQAYNNGYIIRYYDYDDDRTITIENNYNSEGLIISKMYVDLEGKIEFGKNYKYKYDSNDNIIEKIVLDDKNNIDSVTIYKYDKEQRIIRKCTFDSDSVITSKDSIIYHTKGTEKIHYMYDGEGDEKFRFRWQIIGDYRFIESYKPGSKIPYRKSTRHTKNDMYFTNYSSRSDHDGITTTTKEKFDNKQHYYIYSSLNNKGTLIYQEKKIWIKPNQLIHTRTRFSDQGIAESLEKSVYFFDKNRNWILKHYYDLDGLKIIEERKIVYY